MSDAAAISTVTAARTPPTPNESRNPATTTFVQPGEADAIRTTGSSVTGNISVHSSKTSRPFVEAASKCARRKRRTRASAASGTVTVAVESPGGTSARAADAAAHPFVSWKPSDGPVNATSCAFVGTFANASSNERPPCAAKELVTVVKRSPVAVRRNVPAPVSAKRRQTFVKPRFSSSQELRESYRSERRSEGSMNVTATPCTLYCRDHSLHCVP